VIFGLVAIGLLAAAACSGSASTAARPAGVDTPVGAPADAPTSAPMAAPTAAPTAASYPGDGTTESASSGGGVNAYQVTSIDTMIVRTGSLQLEVKDIDGSLLTARAKIVGLGGYVSDSERVNKGEDNSMALITYRIPANRWDEALDALHGLATKVVGENTKAVEVTGQVVDLNARITNLQATEKALQAIMVKATRIADILDVQNQLTNVQGEIEQLTAQKNHLSDQAAMGTLAVTFTLPVVTPVTKAAEGFDFGAEVQRAVAQLVQLGQGLVVIGVWLAIVGLPTLLGVLLVVALAFFVFRKIGVNRPGATLGRPDAAA
jgi:hypothetical protein